ncbi:hypothetical protein LG272_03730 [Pseudidiomarina marina]|uniref:Uncharacterized protein n=1 Tax=Pseudidiomarina marina TaxID=502366 RepID=A0A432YEE9_9GAMM|nr:hypothetical protein [Pseudidiomarina marina]PHR66223.1 MAG: hypothetical protein COA51_02580 [Idiomarina sp.]RUO59321.1 hypothetical protein CWI76_09835 [Pseudidiomarina marina]
MKLSAMSVIVATSIVLTSAMGASAWHTQTSKSLEECQALMQNSEQPNAQQVCQAQQQNVTWGSWFSGKSRSTQFHFLDLFELLFGSSESSKRDYNRPISG